jgi:AmiR/NasT family two-component response regulator
MSRAPALQADAVLIVEDEFLIAEGLCAQIEDMGLTVCGVATTVAEAVALAWTHKPALVLMDMRLRGEGDGVDASLAIHSQVGSKIVFVTGSTEPGTMARIATDHAQAVLFKPVSEQQLRETVLQALGR